MSPHGSQDQTVKNLEDTIKDLKDRINRMKGDRLFPFGSSNANLYFAVPRQTEPRSWLERMLRWLSVSSFFKLKPFGEPHDPMARNSLYFAQWLLTGIFLMELVGWSLMFNEILNAGVLTWSFASIPAIFFGVIFAFGIIALEQAILTADVIGGWGKLKGTLVVRIFLIACSAAITTQPFELLVFNSEIKDRIHQESIRAELVLRNAEYHEVNRALAAPTSPVDNTSPSDVGPSSASGGTLIDDDDQRCPARIPEPQLSQGNETGDVFEAQVNRERQRLLTYYQASCAAVLSRVQSHSDAIAGGLRANNDLLSKATQQIKRLGTCGPGSTDAELRCRNELQQLKQQQSGSEKRIAELTKAQSAAALAKDRFEANRETLERLSQTADQAVVDAGTETTPKMLIERRTQLRAYLREVLKSEPDPKDGTITLPPYRKVKESSFQDQKYGLTNKVRVLYSELAGAPYQWPTDDVSTKNEIEREFSGLKHPEPGWTLYRTVPWAVVLVMAMFLPLVSLGYKFTLNENLNLYFNTEYQELLGHVGATIATEAKKRFFELHPRKGKGRGKREGDPPSEGSDSIRFDSAEAGTSRQPTGAGWPQNDQAPGSGHPPSEEPFDAKSDGDRSAHAGKASTRGNGKPENAGSTRDGRDRGKPQVDIGGSSEPWKGRVRRNPNLSPEPDASRRADGSLGEAGYVFTKEDSSSEHPEI